MPQCSHTPPCPSQDASDRFAAQVIQSCPEQGWTLLCGGLLVFEDTGALDSDGRIIPPGRIPTADAAR